MPRDATSLPSWGRVRFDSLMYMLAFSSVCLAWLSLRPVSEFVVQAGTSFFAIGAPLIALPWCFGGYTYLWRRLRPHDARPRLPPGALDTKVTVYLGIAALSGIIGMIIISIIYMVTVQINHQSVSFPTWNDPFFFAVTILISLSAWALPIRPTSRAVRTRVFIDSLMIVSAAFAFGWYFLFGALLAQPHEAVFSKIAQLAYPLGNLFSFVLCLALGSRVDDVRARTTMNLLTLHSLVAGISNMVIHYQRLHHLFLISQPWNVTVVMHMLILGLAGRPLLMSVDAFPVRKRIENTGTEISEKIASTWRVVLPYAFLPAVGVLVVYTWQSSSYLRLGVWISGSVLVGLVLMRQVFALLENQRLYRQIDAQNRALTEANTRLGALATTDPITELANHRAMVALLDAELSRAHRHTRPCAVLFLDVDHFKALNDTWGHQIGDAALFALSASIKESIRTGDTVGRWGGEEFIVLLPETDTLAAVEVAERIRLSIASMAIGGTGSRHVTCSIGIAVYPHHATDRDELIEAADHAMYSSKALGRNQVRVVDDPVVRATEDKPRESHEHDHAGLVSLVEMLAAFVDARDRYTGDHSHAVATLAWEVSLALEIAGAERQLVAFAGRLHDIGKVGLPDAILLKDGPLSEEEWLLVREHPSIGADIVERTISLHSLAPLIRAHHERWDGSGYPRGLRGDEIPLGARIISVVDAFSAMTEIRPYRKALTASEAILELHRQSGTQFDPEIVAVAVAVMERQPGYSVA